MAQIEQARIERLRQEVGAWRLAEGVRKYVEVLRGRLPELNDEDRARVAAWCDWAEAWAERSDPTVNVAEVVGLEEAEAAETPFWWGTAPQLERRR